MSGITQATSLFSDKPAMTTYRKQLTILPSLTTTVEKTALMRAIAQDIALTITQICKHVELGALSLENVAPIQDVIAICLKTELSYQLDLERRLARYRRLARHWRAERRELRRKIAKFSDGVHSYNAVARRWLDLLDSRLVEAKRQLKEVKGEYDNLADRLAELRREEERKDDYVGKEKEVSREAKDRVGNVIEPAAKMLATESESGSSEPAIF
jgi:DNA repair exonuclease SbcCD ATPase subunit